MSSPVTDQFFAKAIEPRVPISIITLISEECEHTIMHFSSDGIHLYCRTNLLDCSMSIAGFLNHADLRNVRCTEAVAIRVDTEALATACSIAEEGDEIHFYIGPAPCKTLVVTVCKLDKNETISRVVAFVRISDYVLPAYLVKDCCYMVLPSHHLHSLLDFIAEKRENAKVMKMVVYDNEVIMSVNKLYRSILDVEEGIEMLSNDRRAVMIRTDLLPMLRATCRSCEKMAILFHKNGSLEIKFFVTPNSMLVISLGQLMNMESGKPEPESYEDEQMTDCNEV